MDAFDRSPFGTSAPRLAAGGAALSFVPVSGLEQSISSRVLALPLRPMVPTQALVTSRVFSGSLKLCQLSTQPGWPGKVQGGRPVAGRSLVTPTGQPTI